jgi:mRNA-degrading endonuclease HigB of HigAB toxin-antitoxin module
MKKVNIGFYCIFFFVVLNGCRNIESSSTITVIDIENGIVNTKPQNISDFKCEIDYVPLKDNSILLRSATLVDFSDNSILVSDRTHCILYDRRGNRVAIIGRKGKGPGEYSIIMSMKFGALNKIFIEDVRSFLEYDLEGNFLQSFKLDVNPRDGAKGIVYNWSPFNDSLFLGQVPNDSGKERNKAVFFNLKGNTVKSVVNYELLNKSECYTSDYNTYGSIYKFSGDTYFKEIWNDTLFRVNNNYGFEPIYYFNLGKFGPPRKVRELKGEEMAKEMHKYITISKIFESSIYLFLDCNFHDNNPAKRSEPIIIADVFGNKIEWWYYPTAMLGVYNKSNRVLTFAKTENSDDRLTNSGLRNDYDGGINFFPKVKVNDSTLAMTVNAYELKEHVASKAFKNSTPKYPEKKKQLEQLANSLSENDNPVLILCTFKK